MIENRVERWEGELRQNYMEENNGGGREKTGTKNKLVESEEKTNMKMERAGKLAMEEK